MNTASSIGRAALIPNPALEPLSFLLGEWRTTGAHFLMPGKTFHGRTSFAWHLGGAFLIMHSEIDEPDIPGGVAIFGSDDAHRQFFMSYFDERGVSRKYDVTITPGALTWARDDPKLAQRNTLTLDGDKLIGKGRMSQDAGAWTDDLSLTYTRA